LDEDRGVEAREIIAGRVQEAVGDRGQGGKVEHNNHREVQDCLPHRVLPLQLSKLNVEEPDMNVNE